MSQEIIQPSGMLEQQLQPIISKMRAEPPESIARYRVAQNWFNIHEENLASNIADLTYLCRLNYDERSLLTYPVMGNWFLNKISSFTPASPFQEKAFAQLRAVVKEKRFANQHMLWGYEDIDGYNRREDAFNALLLQIPEESLPLDNLLKSIVKEIGTAVYEGHLPPLTDYTIDLGHGLYQPAKSFSHITWNLAFLEEKGMALPLDKTIMIVDDERASDWYDRMTSVGFQDVPGRQGYFADCESALAALIKDHYDVILTDLNLGKGRMRGEEFAKLAYRIQKNKGIQPLISVFSDDPEALRNAEDTLWHPNSERILFNQPGSNDLKMRFTAIGFRRNISMAIELAKRRNEGSK